MIVKVHDGIRELPRQPCLELSVAARYSEGARPRGRGQRNWTTGCPRRKSQEPSNFRACKKLYRVVNDYLLRGPLHRCLDSMLGRGSTPNLNKPTDRSLLKMQCYYPNFELQYAKMHRCAVCSHANFPYVQFGPRNVNHELPPSPVEPTICFQQKWRGSKTRQALCYRPNSVPRPISCQTTHANGILLVSGRTVRFVAFIAYPVSALEALAPD